MENLQDVAADSLLGEAMATRPLVLMAGEVLKNSALEARHGVKAESYIKLSEQLFEKWDERAAWSETRYGGMITVVHTLGQRLARALFQYATGKITAAGKARFRNSRPKRRPLEREGQGKAQAGSQAAARGKPRAPRKRR